MYFWLQTKLNQAIASAKVAMKNERGDTNFISILIILGLVIILAGVFMGFKDKIVGMVNNIVANFVIS